MTKRKIVIIALFVLSAISVAYIYSKMNNKKPAQTTGVLPKPKIESVYGSGVSVTFDRGNYDLPKELPVLEVSNPSNFDMATAKQIASKFSFNFEPRIFEDTIDGTTYIFDDGKSSIYIRAKTRKVEYYSYINPKAATDKNLNIDQIQNIAREFLINTEIIDKENINFSFFRSYKIQTSGSEIVQASFEDSNYYEVFFSQKFSNLSILDRLNTTPFKVTVLPSGEVLKAEIHFLGEIKNSESTYPVKTFQDIKASGKEYVLISINGSDSILENIDTTKPITMNVEKITVGYFRENINSDILQPIFLLEGPTNIPGSVESFNGLMYLPALK